MSYQYWDAQGNNYVRGWGNDFTDAEKQQLGIGKYYGDGQGFGTGGVPGPLPALPE